MTNRWTLGSAAIALSVAFGTLALVRHSIAGDPAQPAAALSEKEIARRKALAAQFDQGARHAVLIGINEFDDRKALPALRFCVPDAKLFADVLVKRCAYPAANITLLADGEPASRVPTRENILREIMSTLRRVRTGDTVLIYVACHGGQGGGKSHLCPKDFDSAHAGLTDISVEHLRDLLQSCHAAQKVLVLDACHSGASGAGGKTGGIGDVTSTMQSSGLITFAAASAEQSAKEDAAIGHGYFTYHFAGGLGGLADRDRDGIVDSDEAYSHVYSEVRTAVGNSQTPVRIMGGEVRGIFALARVAGEAYVVPAPPAPKVPQAFRNSIGMDFAVMMPGLYFQGSPPGEVGRVEYEEEREPFVIREPVLMGRREVTQGEYESVMHANPAWFQKQGEGKDAVDGVPDTRGFPVEQVSWGEAVAFCAALTALPAEKQAGRVYRLPTEGEWEYGCRAGTTTAFATGDLLSSTEANVNGDKPFLNSKDGPNLKRTTSAESYKPNAWGLYDLHGNVWEWCGDWFGRSHGARTGDRRVMRGGSYAGDVSLCRSASRRGQNPGYKHKTIGFRVVCIATGS